MPLPVSCDGTSISNTSSLEESLNNTMEYRSRTWFQVSASLALTLNRLFPAQAFLTTASYTDGKLRDQAGKGTVSITLFNPNLSLQARYAYFEAMTTCAEQLVQLTLTLLPSHNNWNYRNRNEGILNTFLLPQILFKLVLLALQV